MKINICLILGFCLFCCWTSYLVGPLKAAVPNHPITFNLTDKDEQIALLKEELRFQTHETKIWKCQSLSLSIESIDLEIPLLIVQQKTKQLKDAVELQAKFKRMWKDCDCHENEEDLQ